MAHRPNILALASKISLESMTYTGITYSDPEYKILDPIVDDDMCSVMMRMRLETDFSVEDLAKKTKKSVEFVQTQCDKLVKAGVIRTRVATACSVTTTRSGYRASWRAFSPTVSSVTRTPSSARALRSIPASASVCWLPCSATA